MLLFPVAVVAATLNGGAVPPRLEPHACLLLRLEAAAVGGLLLVSAGLFLCLGASDLIPSLTTPMCRERDVLATACGTAVIALVTSLVR